MRGMEPSHHQPFIVAVSGGVDSVVLLDIMTKQKLSLVVAHVDHGIRPDSAKDEAFVRTLAKHYDMPFESVKLSLGKSVSEEVARRERYAWLEEVRAKHGAHSIATAHHEDDVFETIAINLLRGTGWRGPSSLRQTPTRYRPLLSWSKAQIVGYALDHDLTWREDETNDTFRYLRNRVRHRLASVSPDVRDPLRVLYDKQVALTEKIDTETNELLNNAGSLPGLDTYLLTMVDESCGKELLRAWLDQALPVKRFDELLLFAKTARPGARWSLDAERFVVKRERRLIVLTYRG